MKAITLTVIREIDLLGMGSVSAIGTRFASLLLRVVTGQSDYRSVNDLGRLGSENDGFTGQPVALLGGGMV